MSLKIMQTKDGYYKVEGDTGAKTALYKEDDFVSYSGSIHKIVGLIVSFSTDASGFTFYYKLANVYDGFILEKINEDHLSSTYKKTLKYKIKSNGT